MPSHAHSSADKSEISIRITPTIEREFKRRHVFPELRLGNAFRIVHDATGWHRLSIERAKEVLADAQANHAQAGLSRWVRLAYGALAKNVSHALRQEARRYLIADPGMDEVLRRQKEASATMTIGENVLYFRDGEDYGQEAVIVRDFDIYRVYYDSAPYIDSDDQRFEYRYGYGIELKHQRRLLFVRASQLTKDDLKPTHLRMVR